MSGTGLHILIVQDDPATLGRMAEQMQARGCERVSTAADGMAALQIVREQQPDVVIASTTTPKLNGYQLCRLLHSPLHKNGTKPPPVILTTNAHDDLLCEELARSVHAVACVHSTYDPDGLYELAASAVDGATSAAPAKGFPRAMGRALIITANQEDAAALELILSVRDWNLHHATSLAAAQAFLSQQDFELVFCDDVLRLGGSQTILRDLKAVCAEAVIVTLLVAPTEPVLLAALQAGADDYVLLPFDSTAVDIVCLTVLNRRSVQRIYRQFEAKLEELQAMSDYLDMVINYSQEAIFSCDTLGRVRIWNKGAERMYGYTSEEITAQVVDDFLDPPDFTRKSPDVVRILQQRGWSFVEPEILRRKKDGEVFPVHATYSAILNGDSECIGFSVIERDVGTHKALEAEKIKSARLRAITQTAVTANDQINTPLGVILGYAQFLQRKMVDIAPEDAAALEIIQQQVLKIKGIMNKLKLMSDPIVKNYSIEGVTMLDLSQSK